MELFRSGVKKRLGVEGSREEKKENEQGEED